MISCFILKCDCGTTEEFTSHSAKLIPARIAQQAGWHFNRIRGVCPSCYRRIKGLPGIQPMRRIKKLD